MVNVVGEIRLVKSYASRISLEYHPHEKLK